MSDVNPVAPQLTTDSDQNTTELIPQPLHGTRKEDVLSALDSEIKQKESQDKRPGWTTWAISGAM